MLYLFILVIFLLFLICYTNDNFIDLNNNDIIKDEILKYSTCYVDNDTTNPGKLVTIKTKNGDIYNTCDFGLADDNNNCDINNNKVKSILTINKENRCRLSYNGPYR